MSEITEAIEQLKNEVARLPLSLGVANDIVHNGIREPIQVSLDGYIVSGHRRYEAAKHVGLLEVPINRLDIQRSDHSRLEWQQVLRAHNHQRVKSSSVRMKEALLDIDPDLAYMQLTRECDERDRDAPPSIMGVTGVPPRQFSSLRNQAKQKTAFLP